MISDETFLAISHSCDFEDYTFNDSPHNESKPCNDAIAEANAVVGDYVNNYDVILDVCYPSIVMQELRLRQFVRRSYIATQKSNHLLLPRMHDWLFSLLLLLLQATKISVGVDVCMSYERFFYFNLPEVQQALHANRTHLKYQWSMCSE
jgi:serine carboxypeptidase-like clade II